MGPTVSTANVPRRENNNQGGLISALYSGERIRPGDAFWVLP